ncbi:MAG: AraC family transcriptional regulator [Verrucomicrobiota bacterium]
MSNPHKSPTSLLPAVEDLRRRIFKAAPGLAVAERLFDSVEGVIFCIKNPRGQYVAVNTAFVEQLGLPDKTALLGRRARDLFPPGMAAGYEQQDDELFRTGREISDKLEMLIDRKGQPGWFLTQKTPVTAADGKVIALASTSANLHLPAGSDPGVQELGGVIDTIRSRYAEPLRIEELAAKAGMTLAQLERRMKKVLRLSARQFLTRMRLHAAAAALRGSEDAIIDIATDCGFYDQSTLSRQFRAATGFSPGEYRALCRAGGGMPV